jgi:hypothetical protein
MQVMARTKFRQKGMYYLKIKSTGKELMKE